MVAMQTLLRRGRKLKFVREIRKREIRKSETRRKVSEIRTEN